MGKCLINLIVLFFFVINCTQFVFTQEISKNDEEKLNEAIDLFDNEDFNSALNHFLNLQHQFPDNFEINYYIGACYLNSRYNQQKAIPYLEKLIVNYRDEIPSIVYKDLGDIYHSNYHFKKAIEQYKYYLNSMVSGKNI